jgi:hypothetical protein
MINYLTIVSENFSNHGGYQPIALDIIGLLSILSGIFVIISKNPIIKFRKLINLWDKLSNSGEALKFIIPSSIRKNICG